MRSAIPALTPSVDYGGEMTEIQIPEPLKPKSRVPYRVVEAIVLVLCAVAVYSLLSRIQALYADILKYSGWTHELSTFFLNVDVSRSDIANGEHYHSLTPLAAGAQAANGTLLVFLATDCGACAEAAPAWVSIAQKANLSVRAIVPTRASTGGRALKALQSAGLALDVFTPRNMEVFRTLSGIRLMPLALAVIHGETVVCVVTGVPSAAAANDCIANVNAGGQTFVGMGPLSEPWGTPPTPNANTPITFR